MRLTQFLSLLLQAQAEVLKQLALLFGDEELVELLEERDETLHNLRSNQHAAISLWRELQTTSNPSFNPMGELQGAVRETGIPEVLEFYLWAFPYYRDWIESDLDLDGSFPKENQEKLSLIIEYSVQQGKRWVQTLPIPSTLGPKIEKATEGPWVRFRAQCLASSGQKALKFL